MQTSAVSFRNLIGAVALTGLLGWPDSVAAQDRGQPPPQPPAGQPPVANHPGRGHQPLRRLIALVQAGKFDEARQLADRLSRAMANRPQATANRPQPPAGRMERKRGEWLGKRPELPATAADTAQLPPRVKIQHLRQAAEQLEAAGNTRMAGIVRGEIQQTIAQVKRQQQPQAEPQAARPQAQQRPQAGRPHANRPPSPRPEGKHQRAADAGPQDDAAAKLKAENQKLRRELGEIRGAMRKLKQATPPPAPIPPSPPAPPAQ